MQPGTLDELPATRREILRILKNEAHATIPRIASLLGLAHESVRQQMADLVNRGWVKTHCLVDDKDASSGRPAVDYCLTTEADNFFPKNYDGLLVQALDVTESLGDDALVALLSGVTEIRVERLRGRAHGAPLADRVEALREIYYDGDPFTGVESREPEEIVVTERCCPFLNVALERPIICSSSVSAMRKLVGFEVVRERRFQDGDGRCEFHIKLSRPDLRNSPVFKVEPPRLRE